MRERKRKNSGVFHSFKHRTEYYCRQYIIKMKVYAIEDILARPHDRYVVL